jgi:hypothetical protein
MILAIDALKVTVGKENIAYSPPPADDRFFPMMDADGRNIERGIAFTIS